MKRVITFFVAILSIVILVSACKKEYCYCSAYFQGKVVDEYQYEKEEDQNCKDFEDGSFQVSTDSTGIICR